VVAGLNGIVYIKTYANGGWVNGQIWASLGAPPSGAASALAISSWGPNHLDVFVRGFDNQLYQRTYDSKWGNWTLRGNGTFKGKPTAVSSALNRIDVMVTGMDDHLYWLRTADGGQSWLGYTKIPNGTVYPGSSPAIGARGVGLLDVYFRGGDQTLWQINFSNNAWGAFVPLGGLLYSDPAVVERVNPTRIDLAVVNLDLAAGRYGVWWRYWPNADLKNHYLSDGTCFSQ
jgi:hypothetical protein